MKQPGNTLFCIYLCRPSSFSAGFLKEQSYLNFSLRYINSNFPVFIFVRLVKLLNYTISKPRVKHWLQTEIKKIGHDTMVTTYKPHRYYIFNSSKIYWPRYRLYTLLCKLYTQYLKGPQNTLVTFWMGWHKLSSTSNRWGAFSVLIFVSAMLFDQRISFSHVDTVQKLFNQSYESFDFTSIKIEEVKCSFVILSFYW